VVCNCSSFRANNLALVFLSFLRLDSFIFFSISLRSRSLSLLSWIRSLFSFLSLSLVSSSSSLSDSFSYRNLVTSSAFSRSVFSSESRSVTSFRIECSLRRISSSIACFCSCISALSCLISSSLRALFSSDTFSETTNFAF
jgi:hypothetical protein